MLEIFLKALQERTGIMPLASESCSSTDLHSSTSVCPQSIFPLCQTARKGREERKKKHYMI